MNDYIDAYCERLEPGLWAEPLNAVSNLAFFVAFALALNLARNRNALRADVFVLLALLLAIAIGSTLFHTVAVVWAMLADTIPIALFQITFVVIYARQVIGLSWLWVGGLVALLFLTGFAFSALPAEWANGTLGYAPAFIFLAGLGIYHWLTDQHAKRALLIAGIVFLFSMTVRSIDMAVCNQFPYGTHYAWHLLNAVVLYLCMKALIENVAEKAPPFDPAGT